MITLKIGLMKKITAVSIRVLAEAPRESPINIMKNWSDAKKFLTFSVLNDTQNYSSLLYFKRFLY